MAHNPRKAAAVHAELVALASTHEGKLAINRMILASPNVIDIRRRLAINMIERERLAGLKSTF